MGVSYILFFVFTLLQNDFFIELFSPLTAILAAVVIFVCLKSLGRFLPMGLFLALGILSWAVSDVVRFACHYIFALDPLNLFVRTVYLLPNYFFLAALIMFLLRKMEKRDLIRISINTFVAAIVGIAFLRRILIMILGEYTLDLADGLRAALYFIVNSFTLLLMIQILFMTKFRILRYRSSIIMIGVFLYVVLDFQYTYREYLGQEAENIYQNLAYMAFMLITAFGVYLQAKHRYEYELPIPEYTAKTFRNSVIVVLAAAALCLILRVNGFLGQNEFLYILIAFLAYLIMAASFRNNVLTEQLLKSTDLLTGLYNRTYSDTALAELMKKTKEQGGSFAVFCIDLNAFKPINDTYGHEMGDRVLKEFGTRMLAMDKRYTAFRTGGDEFMIICAGTDTEEEVHSVACKVQKIFNTPVELDTYTFRLSGSIGISVFPKDTEQADELLRYADAAMYSVKQDGHRDGFRRFDTTLVRNVEKRTALEELLRKADPARDFALYYQPQFDGDTGALIGAEVFPRLKGEGREKYTPAEIIPLAEETGLMNRLGTWIAQTALQQAELWHREYKKRLSITLNLTPLQLLDADFLELLEDDVARLKIPSAMVNLDVNNDVIMGAAGSAKLALRRLHDRGFLLSVNDFGGGDINLNYIQSCGFDGIHVSKQLIEKAKSDPDARSIISTIAAIAGSMGMQISAVGVETKEQAELMQGFGATMLQGYYFGLPQTAEEFERLLG